MFSTTIVKSRLKILLGIIKKINHFLSKIDAFSPAVFFPMILGTYTLLGHIFNLHRSEIFDLKYSTFPLLLVAIITYYSVYYIVKKRNFMLPTIKIAASSKLFLYGIAVLTVIGFFSFVYMIFTGQIGISDDSVRRHLNPKLNLLSAFFWFGYLILLTEYIMAKQIKKNNAVKILSISAFVVVIMFVLIGYRTNLFMIIFTLILFFHYHFKRFDFKFVLSIVLLASIVFSVFGYIRVIDENKSVAFNQDPVEYKINKHTREEIKEINTSPEWLRVVTAEFVNGDIVLSRIVQYTNEKGSLKGKLHLSAFQTLLPGKNLSPRTIVTNVVNRFSDNGIPVTRKGRTTTPSLMGQLFLDGGYILLIVGIGLISLLLTSLYNRLKMNNQINHKISYSFLTTLFAMSVHTGLLDIIFYIFFFGMFLYSLLDKKTNITITKEV